MMTYRSGHLMTNEQFSVSAHDEKKLLLDYFLIEKKGRILGNLFIYIKKTLP